MTAQTQEDKRGTVKCVHLTATALPDFPFQQIILISEVHNVLFNDSSLLASVIVTRSVLFLQSKIRKGGEKASELHRASSI